MSFFNYFTDRERGGAQKAITFKNRVFHFLGPRLIALHIHPDAISYLGLALLTGVIIWFVHHPYRALGLLILYVVVDGLDGAYARYLNRPSQAGAFTDIVVDQIGMVVITLGFMQYGMVDPQIGAYYILIYLVMITFSVVQNAQKIPMQYIFRSKYVLYGIYLVWVVSGFNLAPALLPIFCVMMTVSVVQSFLRLKRGFHFKYDMPKLLEADQKVREEGGRPPRFWPLWNVVLPGSMIVLLLFLGVYTQIVSMVEPAQVKPVWRESRELPLVSDDERPRAIAAWDEGWLVLTYNPKDRFDRVYHLVGDGLSLQGSFRIPWSMHRDHGAAADGERLYIADRQSRRIYDVDLPASFERGIAVLDGSFDTTLQAPVGCAIVERNGEKRMLISEYMRHYKTLLVNYERAFAEGTAERSIVGWYRNGGFSRGITAGGRDVFEMNSSLWKDLIYVVDLDRALQTAYIRSGIITRIASPRWRCRDLAISGRTLAVVDGESPVIYFAVLQPWELMRGRGK